MTDFKPAYKSENIQIFEWAQPLCEICTEDLDNIVQVKTPEDAKAIIISLIAMLNEIPYNYGGYGEPRK